MKLLERKEWNERQRSLFQSDPKLAFIVEKYLNYLDKKIEGLELEKANEK